MSEENKKQANIFLFHGINNFSGFKKIQVWKKAFIDKYDENDLAEFEGKNINLEEFITNLQAMPFLSEKRLIILKNFIRSAKKEDQEKLTIILHKIPEHTVLILFEDHQTPKNTRIYKALNKFGKIEEYPAPDNRQKNQFIAQIFNRNRKKIDFSLAANLCRILPTNMWQIENECEKLITYSGKKEINKEMIDQLIEPTIENSVFQMTDAIGNNNKNKALKIFENLLIKGEPVNLIFHMIIRHFRLLALIRNLQERKIPEQEIIVKLKLHPFVVKNIGKQAKNFTSNQIKDIFQKLLNLDLEQKTGKIKIIKGNQNELILALEKLLLKL